MSNLKKKIVASIVGLSMVVMMAPGVAQGITAAELQVQIDALMAQLATLQAQLAELEGAAPAVTGCTITSFDRNLKQGMTGDDVKCLQIILNSDAATQVAASGAGSPGSETTYFGPLTYAAVIKFQEKYAAEVLTPLGLTAGTGFVGAKTLAKLNSILTAGGVVTPPAEEVIVAPLTVALTADSPAAANLQKGTANNVVAKFTLTGSDTAAVNITGLTVKHYGNATDGGVPYVKIFDENNIQVGTDRTVIGGLVNFVLVPALVIPQNGSRTISLTVNLATGAETLTTVQLGIDAASSISGATFTGTFPVKGNVFTIVPAGTLGSLTLSDYGTPPKVVVKIGEKDIILESFIVSAGSREDVLINQMTVKNTGTISDSDITNIRIREVGGAVVAGPANLANKKATLNLTSPVLLTKGTSKKFEVIADIVSGNARTILINLAAGSIVGVGQTSGVNIVNTSATTATTITIGVGQLVVAQSNSHPSGTAAAFIKTVNTKTLAVFSVRAVGENVMMNTIDLKFDGSVDLSSSNYLSAVGLYDGDTLISDLKDSVVAETAQTFTLNWTITADTTKDLKVKAITNTLAPGDGSMTLTITWDASTGYGLASGESVDTTTAVPLSVITVYQTGTYTLAMDTLQTPFNQGVLEPTSNVLLGTIKIRAQREDMKLKTAVLTANVSAGTTTAVASLTIYDSDGTTQLSYPVSVSAGTFSFSSTDLIKDVVFQKDVYKTVFVKGNPVTTSTDYYLSFAASSIVLTGIDSQTDATTTAVNLGSAIQGKFTFTDKILEAKKNVTSPSGTVAHGSAAVYAIWDISNVTNSDLPITSLTLTSKTGLPSGVATNTAYFSLVDENDQSTGLTVASASSTAGTVTFSGSMTIPAASSKSIKLRVNTTNTGIWPLGTQMHWSIYAAADMTVTDGTVGWGGTVWSIPADTNIVTLP